MSSNFGTGQSLFTNQNKDQNPSTSGPTPAASGGLFGGFGTNTTSSSAFGGAGIGGVSASSSTGPGTTGIPLSNPLGGPGTGSAFSGPGLFPLKPSTETAPSGGPTGGTLFRNMGSNTGSSGDLFSNTSTTAGGTGGSPFGFPAPKPSGGIFGSGPSGTSTNTSGTTGGGLFGGATATGGTGTPATSGSTPAAPASTGIGGNLFGAKPLNNAAKPATPNLFSAPATGTSSLTSTTAAGSVPSLFSGLGSQPKTSDTTPSTGPLSLLPGGSLFSTTPGMGATATSTTTNPQPQPAFSLGGATSTGDKAAPTTNTGTGGGLFGNFGATANKDGKPEEKKDGTTTTTLPAFSLGGQPPSTTIASAASTTEKKDGAAPPSLFPGLGGITTGAAKPATPLAGPTSTAPGAGTVTTSGTSAFSVPPPSMLKGKGIEEIVNRWSTELETHVRDFNRFAGEVAVWDRSLIENGNNLAALYNYVLAAEREQNDIDQSLEHIEQQEKELTAIVEMYEKQMADILGGQGGNLRTLDTGPADTERDKNYMLATELHNHLDDLSSSLTQLIESVNSISIGQNKTKPTSSSEDPMGQIAQVLSSHLESLQWIDGASRELEEKVTEVEKRIKDVSGAPQGTPVPGGINRSRGFGLTR